MTSSCKRICQPNSPVEKITELEERHSVLTEQLAQAEAAKAAADQEWSEYETLAATMREQKNRAEKQSPKAIKLIEEADAVLYDARVYLPITIRQRTATATVTRLKKELDAVSTELDALTGYRQECRCQCQCY